jgi:hypothetical protein
MTLISEWVESHRYYVKTTSGFIHPEDVFLGKDVLKKEIQLSECMETCRAINRSGLIMRGILE